MTVAAAARPVEAGFRHEAFFYRGEDEFVGGTAGFVREGLARGERVLVALIPQRRAWLESALGPDAAALTFLDMEDVGRNPGRIIAAWQHFVDDSVEAGRGFRGIGEPIWPARRSVELAECHLHEQLLNYAFDNGPAWRLLCPYDADALAPDVIAGAMRSHPVCGDAVVTGSSHEYTGTRAAIQALLAAPLQEPAAVAVDSTFGSADVETVRTLVAEFAETAGLSPIRVGELVLAANELATNSVRYGGGSGRLRIWHEADALVVEFRDAGLIDELLVGRIPPALSREGGRGLFLVNQLCDLVALRTSPDGTVVRVITWL